MKTNEIRQAFERYFVEQGHQVVPSSSLVPRDDPTLLFTNAGMNQFKDVFLGKETRPYKRAVTVQRVVRAGGKHNDLENVGYTARHHTFFEMLGNFSFGDYFKREAIQYAWTFLTKVLKLPAERLWVTVFYEDDEAADIWLNDIGFNAKRLSRMGEKGNFWQMGDTGPCGPCSEIFYDHGPELAGGPPGSADDDLDRYIEIWNLVFMQYNRQADGSLEPLPHPMVDTGMGLERLTAVLQGVHSNYEIDLFQDLIRVIANQLSVSNLAEQSLRVIADHLRSSVFLILDGVIPSNEGRGYVLRRIIRRALRHGHKLGVNGYFFSQLVSALVVQMASGTPELEDRQAQIESVLHQEESQFARTLDHGMKVLVQVMDKLEGRVLPGETAFKLYDTYGFPLDLTTDIARERGLSVDFVEFEIAMARQRESARKASQFGQGSNHQFEAAEATQFEGYQALKTRSTIVKLYNAGVPVERFQAGDTGVLILDVSPFYAESGGQVGDKGLVHDGENLFVVEDCTKNGDTYLHHGFLKTGCLDLYAIVDAEVDSQHRKNAAAHHSATHLMHAALRKVLGIHVEQRGSVVQPDRLRFDFSHNEPLKSEEIIQIEKEVNFQIRANTKVQTRLMSLEAAKAQGAMALFGEKYGGQVRVLSMGEQSYSVELCGGIHAERTGDIGYFKIIHETGVASGIRRLEAVVGASALEYLQQQQQQVSALCELVHSGSESLYDKVTMQVQRVRKLEKEVDRLKAQLASGASKNLAMLAKTYGNVKVLSAELPGADLKAMRATMDQLKNTLGSSIVLLAAVEAGRVNLLAGVTSDLEARFPANEVVKRAALQVDGKGGGKSDLAQAGGRRVEGLAAALESLWQWAQVSLSKQ